jgi:restriction endonuclease S subunit
MQKYSLKTISKIESGKSFRKKPEENPEGNCLLLQMKDVSINGITDSPLKISMEDINPNNLLKNGDILFVAKGNHNYATTFRSTEPTVAISAFFVIRPDISRVYPEYLAWYINSPEAQKQFEKGRMGATVGNIENKCFRGIGSPSTQYRNSNSY